jgi:hypothetical protein
MDFKEGLSSLSPQHSDQLMAEMQLLSLGHIIPLNITLNLPQLMGELTTFDQAWIDYLPREDRVNDRQGLSLFGLPGDGLKEGLSLPEACKRKGRRLSELEFNSPTEAYRHCKSLHELFDYFGPVGRSFLVKSNAGGWFYPHRDHPTLFRDSMRIIVFCKNSKSGQYDWILDDKKMEIEEGRAYYVNTRLVHRTISYVKDSIHLVMNIAPTWENSQKIVKALQFTH